MSNVCGVCSESTPKYKCPHCEIRYCSLVCFKTHIADHETISAEKDKAEKEQQQEKEQGQSQIQEAPKREVNTTTAALPLTNQDPSSPLHQLLSSPLLPHLLTKYPSLKPSLRRIYQATLHPQDLLDAGVTIEGDDEESLARRWGGHEMRKWTADKAEERALGLLLEMHMRDEGVAEFVELAMMMEEKAKAVGESEAGKENGGNGDGDAEGEQVVKVKAEGTE